MQALFHEQEYNAPVTLLRLHAAVNNDAKLSSQDPDVTGGLQLAIHA
jgi:hypothetical protein